MPFWAKLLKPIQILLKPRAFLHRLTGVSFGRAAVWVFGAWAVLITLLTGCGMVLQKVLGGLGG
jgi:hypothetical protein